MDSELIAQLQRDYQEAPDDTYTNDMHRSLLNLLVSMDARIKTLEVALAIQDLEREQHHARGCHTLCQHQGQRCATWS